MKPPPQHIPIPTPAPVHPLGGTSGRRCPKNGPDCHWHAHLSSSEFIQSLIFQIPSNSLIQFHSNPFTRPFTHQTKNKNMQNHPKPVRAIHSNPYTHSPTFIQIQSQIQSHSFTHSKPFTTTQHHSFKFNHSFTPIQTINPNSFIFIHSFNTSQNHSTPLGTIH